MKSVIAAVLICSAITAAQAADKKNTAAAPPPAITIPKDAVANPDGVSYTWTDKDGKKWIYARTPFGITKSPAAAQTADAPVMTKAVDKGDTVRFERPGPFGTISWEKKKTELTDEERGIFEGQNAKTEQKSGQPD
jgi:hypothetical protein